MMKNSEVVLTYVKNMDDNQLYALENKSVDVNDMLLTELCGLVGENNVKVI